MEIKYFSIYKNNEKIIIRNNIKKELLDIYFKNLDMLHYQNNFELNNKIVECDGIIGIIKIENTNFLLYISESNKINCYNDYEIYKVSNINYIILDKTKKELKSIEEEIINKIKDIITNGFYFSNQYDLTNNQSCQYLIKKELRTELYDYIIESNRNFLANSKFIKQFLIYHKKLSIEGNEKKFFLNNFISVCIYGYIDSFSYDINNDINVNYILISRRNIWCYGIENLYRGLGKYGNVANQIETECIFIYNYNHIFSYIILSSSIPVYFLSEKEQKPNKVKKAFREYMKEKFDEYKLISFIFVNNNKNNEKNELKENFINLLISNKDAYENKFKYYNVSTDENFKDFLNKISNLIQLFSFTENINQSSSEINYEKEIEKEKNRIIKKQIGIFNFIGIDFDTINTFSMILSFTIIQNIIKKVNKIDYELQLDLFFGDKINVLGKAYSNENVEEKLIWNNNFNGNGNEYTEQFNTLWKQNKFYLNSQYKITENEEIKIRKYQRYLNIIFNPPIRQLTFNYQLKNIQSLYAKKSKIKIYIATWNVGAANDNLISLEKLLLLPLSQMPNIYFIGFQEIVSLNSINVISNDNNKLIIEIWDSRILKIINSYNEINYIRKAKMNLGGIAFYVYIKNSDIDYIKDTSLVYEYIKTGLGGTASNKGSCIFSFSYYNSTISVSCSHLCAGASKNQNRIHELIEILDFKVNNLEKKNSSNSINSNLIDNFEILNSDNISNNNTNNIINNNSLFRNSDIFFIFGDLNFRIDTEYENFQEIIGSKNQNIWKTLLDFDQLNKSRQASMNLDILDEKEITFKPTYKYCIGSNEYDYTLNDNKDNIGKKSGKKRNPSWCDRILFKKNDKNTNIVCLEYKSIMDDKFNVSDHRPVYAIFEVEVMKDNIDKKNEIINEINQNINMEISSQYMKKKIYNDI